MSPERSVVAVPASVPGVACRRLGRDGAFRLGEIDRSEVIEGLYSLRGGELVLEEGRVVLEGWPPGVIERETRVNLALYDRGGVIYGAFLGDRLVGFMSLDSRPVCGMRDRLLLDTLHVDAGFRGRGIGRMLLGLAMAIARERGATSLYVSSKPTRRTVEFYLRWGFVVADEYDPEQLASYPEDIPMVLAL